MPEASDFSLFLLATFNPFSPDHEVCDIIRSASLSRKVEPKQSVPHDFVSSVAEGESACQTFSLVNTET